MPQDETDKTVTYIVALHLVENTESLATYDFNFIY